VATKPSDWFTPDTLPLLVGYCQVSVYADQLTADMAKFDLALDDDLPTLALKAKARHGISRERDAQHEKLIGFARSMRLTQQSQRTAGAAGTAARRAAAAPSMKKLWEF
jgi:hypothetical protein